MIERTPQEARAHHAAQEAKDRFLRSGSLCTTAEGDATLFQAPDGRWIVALNFPVAGRDTTFEMFVHLPDALLSALGGAIQAVKKSGMLHPLSTSRSDN